MDRETLRVYDERSAELAEYFRGVGPRDGDIELAFSLTGKSPQECDVLEIGCGDGRDAVAIIPRVKSYVGIDYSEGMLNLARELVPDGQFIHSGMENFDYPREAYDVVFAFASLLHLDKEAVQPVIRQIGRSLRPGGIFYLSSKHADEYKEELKTDQFGNRMFYFYNPLMISDMCGGHFEVVEVNYDSKGTAQWFQMGLRKL